MKSVGEVMAIGRTFKESIQKALRSLEIGVYGFEEVLPADATSDSSRRKIIEEKLRKPNSQRLLYIGEAIREGWKVEKICRITGIDVWFLENIRQIIAAESELHGDAAALRSAAGRTDIPPEAGSLLARAKSFGFSDRRLGKLAGIGEDAVRGLRSAAHRQEEDRHPGGRPQPDRPGDRI
jgi:carbamoyl-phosphate synthase large subunit